MRTGKISESILKRSVLREIENHRKEVIKGAGVGADGAFLSWNSPGDEGEGKVLVSALETVTLPVKNAAYLALIAAANNLAAAGVAPVAAMLSLTFPPGTDEGFLKESMRQAEKACRELHMQIAGGHTEVSEGVLSPVVTAAVMGEEVSGCGIRENITPGKALDIVVTKWIGLEGTSIIAKEKEKELSERYPIRLILDAQEQERYLSVASEAATALKSGVYAMHDVRNGGIFGALWELSQKIGVGLCIDLKKIPVKQETIEICEFYHLNPYELLSGGMLLMAAADGAGLVRALEAEGIPASVVGSTNQSNDKLVMNQDETRCLGPASPDEILKIKFH